MKSPVFTAAAVALLRSPTRPIAGFRLPTEPAPRPAAGSSTSVSMATSTSSSDLALLRAVAADQVLREAVAVSSPSLAGRWASLLQGASADAASLRRTVLGVAAYAARSAGRATPFGLLAGVTAARFGDPAAVRIGAGDRTVTRPDQTLLVAAATGLQTDRTVLAGLRVAAHPQLRERGGRVGVTRSDGLDAPRAGAPVVQEVSVRATAAVRALLRDAAGWITVADLVDRAASRSGNRAAAGTGCAGGAGGAEREPILTAVLGLLSAGLLVTDLLPEPGAPDPLREMLHRIPPEDVSTAPTNDAADSAPGGGAAGGGAAAGGWAAAARAAAAATRGYDALPVGEGRARYQDLTRALLELGDAPHVAQVDVVLDAQVRLPTAVATEAAAAASALWRLFGRGPTRPGNRPGKGMATGGDGLEEGPLAGWHRRFLDRFGTDRLVPLLDVVDERAGLGVPEGYLAGGSTGGAAGHGPAHAVWPADPAVLTAALSLAVARGAVQVDLAEVLEQVGHELPPGPPAEQAPTSAELYARLAAADVESLREGRFWLIDVGFGGGVGGASFARFDYLLDAAALTALREHVRGRSPRTPGAIHVEVATHPLHQRPRNLARCPRWLPHRLCLDEPATAAGDIPPADVAVGATVEGLYLVSVATGRQLVPVVHTKLARWLLPPLARLCLDIGDLDAGTVSMWSWGPLDAAPFLPRVVASRAVLSPATWRLPAPLRAAAAGPADAARGSLAGSLAREADAGSGWAQQLTAWRAAAGVPALVTVGTGDIRLPLDLTDPVHQSLLRREIVDRDAVTVSEWFGPDVPLPVPPAAPDRSAAPGAYPAGDEPACDDPAPVLEGVVDGWFAGDDGPRVAEVVIPLAAARPSQNQPHAERAGGRPAAPVPPAVAAGVAAAVRRPGDGGFVPGGPWLCAHVEVATRDQNSVLAALDTAVLPAVAAAGVDRWFFLRYAAGGQPHLRLRFHGDPAALHEQLLPALHDWVGGLRDAGLAGELVLAGYDPEIERYGGPAALLLAEDVFAADSDAVLATLAAAQPGLAWPAVAAVAAAELAAACDPDGVGSSWLLAARGRATTYRAEVRQLVASGALPTRLGQRTADTWPQRRTATAALAEQLRHDGAAPATRARSRRAWCTCTATGCSA